MSTTQQTQTKSKRNIGKKQRRRKLQLRTKHRRTVRSKPLIGISKSSKKNNNKESISTTKQNSNNNDVNGIKQTENKITTSIIKTTSTTTTETASSSSTISSTAISSTSIGHKTMINKTLRKKKKKGQLGINKAQLKRQKNARDDKKKQKDKKQIADDIDIDKKQKLGKHKIYIHNKQKEREKDSGLLKINGNIEQFKSLKVNQILEIRHLETNKTLTLKISKIEKSGATNWSLSIDSEIAMIFNLNKSMNCDIYLINALSLELLQIEITFKNQYISRGKQWKIETDLINRIVHINENIKNNKKGYDINVKCCKSLKKDGEIVSCGLITRKTKFLWRSNSAWFIYLVQLSKEMWDFSGNDDDGKQIHFEKFIDGFLKTVMAKWKKNQCQHVYSIIFFSRTFYENDDVKNMNASPNTKQRNNHFTYNGTNINGKNINGKTAKVFNLDSDNRYYQDHYMVVVRNWTGNDWNKLSRKLREAFDTFPMKVKWKRGENIEKNGKTGNISVAAEGNLLQAIQLSLNVLDKHYIDRDLHRTGMSITVVTAGNGLYFVDKSLATFTKVRILNNGINCDIVSMSKPPIHPTPLFVYGSPLAFGMFIYYILYVYISSLSDNLHNIKDRRK